MTVFAVCYEESLPHSVDSLWTTRESAEAYIKQNKMNEQPHGGAPWTIAELELHATADGVKWSGQCGGY